MNKITRIVTILEKLSTQERVCVKELAIYLDEEIRNIQNDFKNVLKPYFGNRLNKIDDCYFLLKREQFHDLFQHNHKTSKQFLRVLSIIDSELYNQFKKEHTELIKALKLDSSTIYQIENSPYEHLNNNNKKIIEQIEESIYQQNYINITYRDNLYYAHCIPLKIVYLKDNWYLALLTTNNIDNNSVFKKLRINFIEKVQKTKLPPINFKNDHAEKLKAELFLKNIQSPYSNMGQPTYQVKLHVSKEVARFFKSKQYLKSQKVLETLKNGDILVTYEISHELEIIPLIQQWIPYVHVIEPLELKDKIAKNIEKFTKGV